MIRKIADHKPSLRLARGQWDVRAVDGWIDGLLSDPESVNHIIRFTLQDAEAVASNQSVDDLLKKLDSLSPMRTGSGILSLKGLPTLTLSPSLVHDEVMQGASIDDAPASKIRPSILELSSNTRGMDSNSPWSCIEVSNRYTTSPPVAFAVFPQSYTSCVKDLVRRQIPFDSTEKSVL
ncbi:uncharacterized protein MYU51_018655 [Penicillium brevicompactum]